MFGQLLDILSKQDPTMLQYTWLYGCVCFISGLLKQEYLGDTNAKAEKHSVLPYLFTLSPPPKNKRICPCAPTKAPGREGKRYIETKSEFHESQESLYTVAALAVRSAVKTELSYRNKMIIVILFAANKSKDYG